MDYNFTKPDEKENDGKEVIGRAICGAGMH